VFSLSVFVLGLMSMLFYPTDVLLCLGLWGAVTCFIFARAKVGLRELDRKLAHSRSSVINITYGADGTRKFLQIKGIPIDFFGVIIGVCFAPRVLSLITKDIQTLLPHALLFLSGIIFGLSLYYLSLERKYNMKILIYSYTKTRKSAFTRKKAVPTCSAQS
jgi:hypothetical protein